MIWGRVCDTQLGSTITADLATDCQLLLNTHALSITRAARNVCRQGTSVAIAFIGFSKCSDTSPRCWSYGTSTGNSRPRSICWLLRMDLTTCCCSVLRRWCCRCRFENSRFAARALENFVTDTKCGPGCLQAVSRPGIGEDVEGGGMERIYAWERNELHSYCALFCCAV